MSSICILFGCGAERGATWLWTHAVARCRRSRPPLPPPPSPQHFVPFFKTNTPPTHTLLCIPLIFWRLAETKEAGRPNVWGCRLSTPLTRLARASLPTPSSSIPSLPAKPPLSRSLLPPTHSTHAHRLSPHQSALAHVCLCHRVPSHPPAARHPRPLLLRFHTPPPPSLWPFMPPAAPGAEFVADLRPWGNPPAFCSPAFGAVSCCGWVRRAHFAKTTPAAVPALALARPLATAPAAPPFARRAWLNIPRM